MKKVKILLAITILLHFVGCQYNQRKKDDIIKVGVILPLTGPVAEPGKNVLQGIQLAIEIFNNENKFGRKIDLIIEDSKAEPQTGVTAFNKLVSSDNTKIILGDLISSVTLAFAPIAEKQKIIVLAPGSSNPSISNSGDYIFRNWVSDDFDGKVMADYFITKTKFKKLAIIYVNNDYGVGLKEAFKTHFISLGGEVIFENSYNQGASDFKTIIAKLPLNLDALYLPGNPMENGIIVKQLKEINFYKPLFSNISVENDDFITTSKGYFDSIIYTTPYFDPTLEDSSVIHFDITFNKAYGHNPDVTAAHGYDAANILIDALVKCDFKMETIKDCLYKIQNFPGLTGKTSFDANGDVNKDLMVKKIMKDGTTTIVTKYHLK